MKTLIATLALFALAGCTQPASRSPVPPARQEEAKTHDRLAAQTDGHTTKSKQTVPLDEFRKSVIGKTKAEVKALYGPPDDTQGTTDWGYFNLVIHPDNGKPLRYVWIAFDDDGLCFQLRI